MKIGIVTDAHYCDLELLGGDRKPHYAFSAVKAAFEEFKKQGVQVVASLGDMAHYNDGKDESIKHLREISEMMNSYGIPIYHCMGNHDNEIVNGKEYAEISGFNVAPAVFEDDEVRLIFVDASYWPSGKPYEAPNVDWTQSLVPEHELDWMKKQLNTEKRTVVFTHQNIDKNINEDHIISNADEINGILADYGVSHVFQGHYHYGAENVINGIPYTTLRAMCLDESENYLIAEV